MNEFESLPLDVKNFITSLQNQIQILEESNTKKNDRILSLEQLLVDLRRDRFGKKSERFTEEDTLQSVLFNEAEFGINDSPSLVDGHSEEETETINVKSFNRKKSGRKPLPENLERREVIHDISVAEKSCNCGGELSKIGEETSEKLCIIPVQLYVERHTRYKYACKNCNGDERNEAGKIIITAENKNELFPKSILTPELLAHILTAKFVDHIPFYRQSNIMMRYGFEITRATFCNWSISIYERYKHLFTFLNEIQMQSNYLQIDETTLQVHNEEGKSDTSTSYMFVIRGGPVGLPIVQYIYRKTREAEFLLDNLKKFNGVIQTDGYKSYEYNFKSKPKIIQAACMAHARREFEKVWKATKNEFAKEILQSIKQLYLIEREIREKKLKQKNLLDEIQKIRQEKSKPIMNEIYDKLVEYKNTTPSTLGVGKAIIYSINHWKTLSVFLDHPQIEIDNNLVENEIRPFVVGRKNWLFSDSPKGASASSFWFSLIQTAKANKQEPYKFLLFLAKHLPLIKTPDEMKVLFLNGLSVDG